MMLAGAEAMMSTWLGWPGFCEEELLGKHLAMVFDGHDLCFSMQVAHIRFYYTAEQF